MRTTVYLILSIILISCSSGEKKCTISGGITGGNSKALLLFKASKFPAAETEIPISNNRFTYSFSFDQPEVYWLVLKNKFEKGSANEIPFFGERGKIEITINGDNQAYEVKGHKLNDALFEFYREINQKFYAPASIYKDSINAIYRRGSIYTKEFQALQYAMKKTTDPAMKDQILNSQRALRKSGLMYIPQANRYLQLQDSIAVSQKLWESDYIKKNTTLPAFYFLMQKTKDMAAGKNGSAADSVSVDEINKDLARFSSAFPDHPYVAEIGAAIQRIKTKQK